MKVAVTGGASGIGLAIVDCFASAGHQIFVLDNDAQLLKSVKGERADLHTCLVDVADPVDVQALADEIGYVDILVNNAGVVGPVGTIEEIDPADWVRCFDVNIHGAFYMARAFLPGMKAQVGGSIINIATTSVTTGMTGRSAYVASKGALVAFTKNLAREVGRFGIRCNAILPGTIDNSRGRNLLAASAHSSGLSLAHAEEKMLSYVSMRSWIQPSEVGEACLFLASDQARHITGQCLSVCGGVEWEE